MGDVLSPLDCPEPPTGRGFITPVLGWGCLWAWGTALGQGTASGPRGGAGWALGRAVCRGRIPGCPCCSGGCWDGSSCSHPPADPLFPLPPSSPRQVPLLPGPLLLENDTALPGGPGGLRQVRHPAVPPALSTHPGTRLQPARGSLPTAPDPRLPSRSLNPRGAGGRAASQPWGSPCRGGGFAIPGAGRGRESRGRPSGAAQPGEPRLGSGTLAAASSATQRCLPGANRTRIRNDFVFLLSQLGRVGLGSAGRWRPGTRPGRGRGARPGSCLLPTLPTSICPFLIKTILWTWPPRDLSAGRGHGVVKPQGVGCQCRWGGGCWEGGCSRAPHLLRAQDP